MSEKDIANIEDCLYSIKHIESYTQHISSSDELMQDTKTYDAVLMNFVIMAESCKRISSSTIEKYPDIPWKSIRGFRNYIAHDYFGLDIDVIWQTLTIEIPHLKKSFEKIVTDIQNK